MFPVLFGIGSFEVTSFGVMVAVAALVGLWLFRRELRCSGLPLDATDSGIVGVVAGLIGAKLLWTLEHAREAPISGLLLSRGGLSWYGGLIGGVGAGTLRFFIEFIRVNERVLFRLSVAHLVSLAAVAIGIGILARADPTGQAAYSERKVS